MSLRPARAALAFLVGGLVASPALAQTASGPAPTTPAPATPPPSAAPSAAAAAGEPSAEVQEHYRKVVEQAVGEFDAGRWAEARALFLRAHELWPSARTFRTLGMTSFELRSYVQALQELQAALEDPRRSLPPEQQAEVSALIEKSRAFLGRYRVRLSPPDAELLVNGRATQLAADGMLLLEVGSHELIARAPGHSELRQKLTVQGREDQEIVLALESGLPAPVASAPQPRAMQKTEPSSSSAESGRLWTWIATGAAVVLGGTSAGLWLASDAEYEKVHEECVINGVPTCMKGVPDDSWQDLETAHQITLGFALGAGVAAVVLFFVEGDTEQASETRVAVGPGAVSLRGRF